MAAVTIRFIEDRGFVSRGIAWFTNSLFSHCEFQTPAGTWVGAHVGSGVEERAPDYCQPVREYIYDIPCTQDESDALWAFCASRMGCEYNSLAILGLMFRRRQWTAPGRLICSQFCCQGLLEVFGAHRVLNVLSGWTFLITPEMLHLSPILVGHRRK